MAILDSLTNSARASAPGSSGPLFAPRNSTAGRSEERVDAEVWVNIGYYVVIGDEKKFVNLPLGMPLDTMKPVKITGQNEDWIKLQSARNQLLDEMQKVGAALAPGETRDLTAPGGLVIQLRRIAEKPAAVEQNDYAIDLTKLMFGGAANQIPAE